MTRFPHYLLLFVVGLFLLAGSAPGQAAALSKPERDIPLPEFILGKWEGNQQVTQGNKNYQVIDKIEFKSEHTFEMITTSPDTGDFDYSGEFTYRFIGENVIQVHTQRISGTSNWKIEKSDEKLNVCFRENDCELMVPKNFPPISWLALIAVAAIFGLLIFIGCESIRSLGAGLRTCAVLLW